MKSFFLLAAPSLGAAASYAQLPGSGGPTPENPPSSTDVPLDGGASLLLTSGVAYGLRRLRRKQTA